jgi:peptidoglycan/LPS O-acetylase OafA/YrhL
VRPAVPAALGVLILVALLVTAFIGGLRDEIVVLGLLGPAAVGMQIGWFTRANVPTWVFVALAVVGIALVLAGFSQYDDDEGESGALLVPFVGVGIAALVAAALVGGIAAGASWRRTRD